MLVCGIVQSQSVKLDDIAENVESASKIDSQTMQFRRWLRNDRIDAKLHYLPFIQQLLHSLAKQPLVLMIDGTTCARGCMTLMVSMVYRGRALPLMWLTRKSKKGHFPEHMHVELIRLVKDVLPFGTEVICLGDGEFDGCQWLQEIKRFGWHFACRTAKNAVFYEEGERFSIHDICPERGTSIEIVGLEFTDARAVKVNAVVYWGQEYKDPLYLVTNFPTAGEAHFWYRKRFKIETLFSDWKGRGFNVQKSGLSDPSRVNRLLIAVALAYVWMIYLGKLAMEKGWNTVIHRTDRCDLSLFRMGSRLLMYFLKQSKALPPFCLVLSVELEC